MVKKLLDGVCNVLSAIVRHEEEPMVDVKKEHQLMESHFNKLNIYKNNCGNLSADDRQVFYDKLYSFSRDFRINIESEENLEICKKYEDKCKARLSNAISKMPNFISNVFGGPRDLDRKEYAKLIANSRFHHEGYLFDEDLKFIKSEIERVELLITDDDSGKDNALKRRYIHDLREIRVQLHKIINK